MGAAAEFLARMADNPARTISRMAERIVVTDLDTGEVVTVNMEEILEEVSRQVRGEPKVPLWRWPRWWEVGLLLLVAAVVSAVDAGGLLVGEWNWSWGRFIASVPFLALIALAAFLAGSHLYYLIKRNL